MTPSAPIVLQLRTAELSARRSTPFDLKPGPEARAALAGELGLIDLPLLRFQGEVTPSGRRDLLLRGRLTARVVQPCVVTLAPVTTSIDEPVERAYVEDFALPEGDEVEIPADDRLEPLPAAIDIGAVAIEALVLALPPYPRAEGAVLGESVHGPDGVAPLRDADLRPFAGLARLARRGGPGGGDGGPPG